MNSLKFAGLVSFLLAIALLVLGVRPLFGDAPGFDPILGGTSVQNAPCAFYTTNCTHYSSVVCQNPDGTWVCGSTQALGASLASGRTIGLCGDAGSYQGVNCPYTTSIQCAWLNLYLQPPDGMGQCAGFLCYMAAYETGAGNYCIPGS